MWTSSTSKGDQLYQAKLVIASMSLSYVSSLSTLQSFTPNDTPCNSIVSGGTIDGVRVGMSLNTCNSLINKNTSYTNEPGAHKLPKKSMCLISPNTLLSAI